MARKTDLWVADFETAPIGARPSTPEPVGLALQGPGHPLRYYAWGHASGNGIYEIKGSRIKVVNGDPKQVAMRAAKDAWKGPILGHNIAKFDLPVAEDHLGLKAPSWDRVHDSMFSLFLRDPHANSLSLKPSAERLLDEPPTERDAVYDWLADHGIIAKPRKVKGVLTYPKDAGAYIAKAPGNVVAAYAMGDVTRALGLHDHCLPYITEHGMMDAYNREREIAPILLDNERRGMRVDLAGLERDLAIYEKVLVRVDQWLAKKLKTPGLNVDSDEDVAKALKKAGIVKKFPQTPTGRDSVSKKNLTADFFSDQKVWAVLYYRNALATVLTMSMRPWFAEGSRNGGYIFTQWNQVRQSHGVEKMKGARSGRITCSYFQNITKDFLDRGDGFKEAWERGDLSCVGFPVPELPLVRVYLLPDEGETFGHSDFDQQELKLVAHYEEGALAELYRRNPKTDVHEDVRQMIKEVSGKEYNRRPVKIVNFRTVYGGGISGLAEGMKWSYEDAAELIGAWKKALPDVVALDKELKDRFRAGDYIRTLGGRIYYVKPPTIAKKGARKGQMIEFSYTALNYLIQPSAADQTKQAIINYHKHPKRKARMIVTVHDEVNISMAKGRELAELKILQDCMINAFKLDVPSTTTLKMGPSWGKLKKVEDLNPKSKKAA